MKTCRLKKLLIFSVLISNFFYYSEVYFDNLSNESPSRFVQESDYFLKNAHSEVEKPHIFYFTTRAWYHLKDAKKAVENLKILKINCLYSKKIL